MGLRGLGMALCLWLGLHGSSRAQEIADSDVEAGKIVTEEVDSTRLDVARLPPEAIEVTRDLYARGFFVEAQLGALGFLGDLGEVSKPGPRLAIGFGYEFTVWLSALVVLDASFHDTKQRPPPSQTMFEMLGAAFGLRLTLPLGARAALWANGVAGIVYTGGDVLRGLGFTDAVSATLAYGGELGFDWHVFARHHSMGMLGGARFFPELARDDYSLGVYGSAYLRYVF
jgi:hypothetical protein